MKTVITENKNEIPNISEYLNPHHSLNFFKDFKEMLLRKFDLDLYLTDLTLTELCVKAPFLRLYSDLMQVMLRQTIFNDKKIKKSDLFDYEKIFYLDYCDYIITNDNSYRALYNDSNNDKLIKRAISLEEFLYHIKNNNLIARSSILDDRINVYEVN